MTQDQAIGVLVGLTPQRGFVGHYAEMSSEADFLAKRKATAERRRQVMRSLPRHPSGRILGVGEIAAAPFVQKETFYSRAHCVYFIKCGSFITPELLAFIAAEARPWKG